MHWIQTRSPRVLIQEHEIVQISYRTIEPLGGAVLDFLGGVAVVLELLGEETNFVDFHEVEHLALLVLDGFDLREETLATLV